MFLINHVLNLSGFWADFQIDVSKCFGCYEFLYTLLMFCDLVTSISISFFYFLSLT